MVTNVHERVLSAMVESAVGWAGWAGAACWVEPAETITSSETISEKTIIPRRRYIFKPCDIMRFMGIYHRLSRTLSISANPVPDFGFAYSSRFPPASAARARGRYSSRTARLRV